jgi:hypothetical protein
VSVTANMSVTAIMLKEKTSMKVDGVKTCIYFGTTFSDIFLRQVSTFSYSFHYQNVCSYVFFRQFKMARENIFYISLKCKYIPLLFCIECHMRSSYIHL